jgi:hypothetical protein
MNQHINSLDSSDVQENIIRQSMPRILDILLIDRTTSTPSKTRNIIWATNNYKKYGAQVYDENSEIKPELVTGIMGNLIKPRALKDREMQLSRTKSKAEVFTPVWIVKKQNDEVDKTYRNDDLETYVSRRWIEITCGEAPYMTSRYDMETGDLILLKNRVGFIDRKLERINREIDDKAEWQRLVELAYKSSYGFEWSGDSLLIARENLLYTYRDFYVEKWGEEPLYGLFEEIAKIISYNIFQMDGVKYIIPLSEKRERKLSVEISLFDDDEPEEEWIVQSGKRVRIMNWDTNKMEYFDKGI